MPRHAACSRHISVLPEEPVLSEAKGWWLQRGGQTLSLPLSLSLSLSSSLLTRLERVTFPRSIIDAKKGRRANGVRGAGDSENCGSNVV